MTRVVKLRAVVFALGRSGRGRASRKHKVTAKGVVVLLPWGLTRRMAGKHVRVTTVFLEGGGVAFRVEAEPYPVQAQVEVVEHNVRRSDLS